MANKIEVQASLRDDLTARLDKVGQSVNRATREFSTMGPVLNAVQAGIAGLALAATAAVTSAAMLPVKYAEVAESLGKLRTATGLSYKELQMLQQALKEAGSAPESLNTAMRILNVNLAQGDKTLAKYHITARTSYAALLQVGEVLAKTGDSTKKSELAMAAFGRSSQDLIDTISKFATDPNMRKAMESVVMSDADIEKLQKLDERFDKAGRAWEKLGRRIAVALAPVAEMAAVIMELPAGGQASPSGEYLSRLRGGTLFKRTPSTLLDLMGPQDEQWQFAPTTVPGGGGGGGKTSFSDYMGRMRGFGWNSPGDRRGITGGGSLGYSRLLASTVSAQVDQPLNTHDAGNAQALQRNVQMVRSMASGVSAGFENMFNSIFMIQRRSKNVVVALFQDLFNGIVSSLTQRAGSAIGGWFLDLALSFIPGGGAVKGAAAAGGANTVINYTSLTAPNLVQSAISPSGELRQANTVLRQMAAVR